MNFKRDHWRDPKSGAIVWGTDLVALEVPEDVTIVEEIEEEFLEEETGENLEYSVSDVEFEQMSDCGRLEQCNAVISVLACLILKIIS